MRIKEVLRTSNISWSPDNIHPIYIAAGTSAKQLDASFSSSCALEIFEVGTSAKGWDMPVKGSLSAPSRFNVIEWGSAEKEMGIIAGGGDNGVVSLWDPAKILSGDETAIECEIPKHSGPVRSLDFNPAKKSLLASGSSSSEIHIVDINSPSVLMTPGPKAQPDDDVVALAWNKQVEHILASAHPNSARSIVWDLRKNEPIIQVTDASNRLRCSCIVWHPDVATQLLTCSDEDRYPVIQMWDLRFATAPTMVLEGHQRGIQTLSWCTRDSSLLLTCGKDDQMICWNPNNTQVPGGEKVVEFSSPSQWTFDMGWCPRNPYLIASSSFSGKLSVFSLFGGQEDIPDQSTQRVRQSSDPFAPAPPPPSLPMNIPPLNQAPKWLMRPCGVSFGFGGKLISFDCESTEVTIMQVMTEPDLLERSEKLEMALQENTLLQFCSEKAETSEETSNQQIWNFLKSTFDSKPRQRYLELLGYRKEDLKEMVQSLSEGIEELSEEVGELGLDSDTALINKSDADSSSSDKDSDKEDGKDEAKLVTQPPVNTLVIDTSDSVDGLISRAMLLGQFEVVVELCLKAGRMADALAVAMAGGRELFQKTQQEYFRKATTPSAALLSCIISQKWSNLVETVELSNWKEALAILLSYAKPTEFNSLCDTLASRLSKDTSYHLEATLCFICSGNVAELMECWQSSNNDDVTQPLQLQELVEKVMCLQSTNSSNRPLEGERVVSNLMRYSQLLAEQGKLANALTYISATPPDSAAKFKYQLHMAINDPSLPRPPAPFTRTRLPSAAPAAPTVARTHITAPPASNYTRNVYAPPTHTSSAHTPSAYAPSAQTPSAYAPSAYTPTTNPPSDPLNNSASIVSGAPSYSAPSKIAYKPPTYTAPEQPATPLSPTIGLPPISQPPNTGYTQPNAGYAQPPNTGYTQPPNTGYTQPIYTPSSGSGSHAGSSASSFTPYMPSSSTETAPPPKPVSRSAGAWNDPPMLKKKAPVAHSVTSQKITNPVAAPPNQVDIDPNSPANQPAAYGNQPMPYGGQQPGYIGQQPVYGGQQPAYGGQQPAYGGQQPGYGGQQQLDQQTYNPASYQAPAEPLPAPAPAEKPPMPEQHEPMLGVLETAVTDCRNSTQNPTHRRKLEEVSNKLEALKDKLRYDRVSDAVVVELNGIAGALSVKDYNQALQLHSRIAQTANFSEVSAFLPGIKLLLQIGAQLHAVHHF